MKKHNLLVMALLAVVPLFSLFCGGSTEIGNARSVITGSITDNGGKVDSAEVQLVAEDYIPGGATADKVFSTVTDCRGNYRFEEVPEGDYYLNAKHAGKRLLRGPIEIAQTEVDLATEELEETARLTISIPTGSEANVVFLQGTDRSWSIESDTVILDSIPSGTIVVVAFSRSGDVPQKLLPENSKTVTVDVEPAETAVAALDNAPPKILTTVSDLSRVIARSDSFYSVAIRADDPEGEEIYFSLASGPAGMTIDGGTGIVRWPLGDIAGIGDYTVAVRISDAGGASRIVSWIITVAEQWFIFSNTNDSASGIVNHVYLFEVDTAAMATANACRFSWGDGDTTEWQTQAEAAHVWKTAGSYPIRFQVQYASDGSLSEWSTALTMEIVGTIDTIPPVITLLGGDSVSAELGQTFTDPGVMASDNIDGAITERIDTTGSVDVNKAGVYVLTYTVSDAAGNTATAQRIVIVVDTGDPDTVRPVITLLGPDTIILLDSLIAPDIALAFKETGYSATDDRDGDITNRVQTWIDFYPHHIPYVVYTVTDQAGNCADTVYRWIFTAGVSSNTSKFIDLVYADSVIQIYFPDGKWVEPGYTATDQTEGDVTSKVVVDSSDLVANLKVPGKYFVTYSLPIGETVILQRIRPVEVVWDSLPYAPAFKIHGRNPDTVIVSSAAFYRDSGVFVEDPKGNDITSRVTVSGFVDMSTIGKYTLIYSVTDSSGLKSSATRIVWVVVDTSHIGEAPVITLIGNVSDTVSLWMNPDDTAYNDPGATAYDVQDGDITANIVVTGSVDINVPWSYSLTYFVRDADSNVTTVERFVEVMTWSKFPENLIEYDVPVGEPLPDLNVAYTTGESYGTGGPDLAEVLGLGFRWDLAQNKLLYFELYTGSGTDTVNVPLDTSRQILGTGECAFFVQGSGIDGLDGPYYVRVEGTTMYWVSFERDVFIVWKE